ncbi:beta-mannosidase [Thalassobacillus sp. B23F22_16]|uniref:beta-mannosidase n=1 Tax=Thalassobacillus sp. B23F22_16 TaxID=3459513 RepID=UPI00373F5687
MLINKDWKLSHFAVGEARDLDIASPDYIDHFWMQAEVPGDVHSTLLKKGLIDDPFYGHNDLKSKWIEEKVWWYRTEFDFDKKLLERDEVVELIFNGLDTFTTIYLNGLELGETANMFISHTFDVTRELVDGKNILAVKFDPVAEQLKVKEKRYWAGFGKDRIWARKAQYHFGWDWGPQIITAGIWKDVRLETKKTVKIENVFARTTRIEKGRANVLVDIDAKAFKEDSEISAVVTMTGEGKSVTEEKTLMRGKTTVPLTINNPKLWWTHDLGDPFLYQLNVELFTAGDLVDSYQLNFGIRDIQVKQEEADGTTRFTFVLNGIEIFAKGANWIPIDSFVGAAPDMQYKHLISLSKEANMNMLRVWGGGIYEKDVFYQECDRQGLLVWQDFMFACALYPDYNRNFMNNVQGEVEFVIKRLRNHPCIALWCGNNENDWLYEVEYAAGRITTPFYGERIFHEMIPGLLKELNPDRFYLPSSPFGGNDHNAEDVGDRHNWQVWHGNVEPRKFGEVPAQNYSVEGVSFKNYKKDKTRFSSEFGMHASASRYTLERNLPEGTFFWGSDEMAYRNKDYHHQKGILLMEGYTGVPEDIEEYMNYSMLTQAEGLKCGVEHYRRNKPETSGTLIWQLNDCWPGTSWSMIDYYLLPKASYYYARKFNQPLLFTLDHQEEDGTFSLWAVNDTVSGWSDELLLEVHHVKKGMVYSETIAVNIMGNQSCLLASFAEGEVLKEYRPEEVVIRLRSSDDKVEENCYYLRDHKDMNFAPANLIVKVNREKQEVEVSTDNLARFVKLEIPSDKVHFSDNFFDLLPGERKVISISHLEFQPLPFEQLKLSAVNSQSVIRED